MFGSVISSVYGITLTSFLICLAASLAAGLIVALVYRFTSGSASSGFVITAAILPAVVQMVIMMVNGNLGAGVAVAGSFSLIRFRSMPGKASDILIIFICMGLGLCTGMGYVSFALIMAIVLSLVYVLYNTLPVMNHDNGFRSLRISIPDDLDYTEVFDDIFAKYTKKHELISARTTNLGTMYQISYEITLKNIKDEKKMLDALRVRNSNLPVICSAQATVPEAL